MGLVDMGAFRPQTADKVSRLLGIADELGRHPRLSGKLVMHGGTAINLFMLDAPRLSVDIDLSYVGAIDRDAMLAERPAIEKGIMDVGAELGYAVDAGQSVHAGRTFVLRYAGAWGQDHVKIDCIYMNRSPLLPIAHRSSPVRPGIEIATLADAELVGGKLRAFLSRVKVRDLYDISMLRRFYDGASSEVVELAHRVVLYNASLSARFPQPFEGRAARFADCQRELEEQLLPMLRAQDDLPTLEDLAADAEAFIRDFALPRSDVELEYLRLFAAGEYRPELLFPEPAIAEAAAKNPEALWKLQNLRKMAAREG